MSTKYRDFLIDLGLRIGAGILFGLGAAILFGLSLELARWISGE